MKNLINYLETNWLWLTTLALVIGFLFYINSPEVLERKRLLRIENLKKRDAFRKLNPGWREEIMRNNDYNESHIDPGYKIHQRH